LNYTTLLRHASITAIAVSLCLFAPAAANPFQESFSAGWHMITIPCEPDSHDPEVVFASPFEEVYAIEGGGYVPKSAISDVSVGKAYWAYFSSDTVVTIDGGALTGDSNNSRGKQVRSAAGM